MSSAGRKEGAWSREYGRVTTNAAWVPWATGEVGSELKKDCMCGVVGMNLEFFCTGNGW